MPLLSIIIPVYNTALYLAACMDSVLLQPSAESVEVICVNDGSTDDSARILHTYAERYSNVRIISQPNGGLSAARNTGLRAASGEYVLFLDSDDWLTSNAIDVLKKELIEHENIDVLAFAGQNYNEDTKQYETVEPIPTGEYATGMDYYNHFASTNRQFPFVCVVLRAYRRQFLLENDLFFGEGLLHEDNLFTPLVCYKAGRVREISDVLYIYRHRSGSITQSPSDKNTLDLAQIANTVARATLVQKKGRVAKRVVCCYYQRAIEQARCKPTLLNQVKQLVDWKLYFSVSLTKPRHIINFWKNRI